MRAGTTRVGTGRSLPALAARAVTLAVTLAATGAVSAERGAGQGYGQAPFRDAPIAVMQAATLEGLALPGGAEVFEDAAAVYAASLHRQDPILARQLHEAVSAGALPRALADAALAALAPKADPAALQAAVAARLLLAETGLAERYENIAEGEDEAGGDGYAFARAALARAAAIVATFAPRLPPAERGDAERLLERLTALLPENPAERPAAPPEAAETLAQGLVALLERAVNADLYIDRDLDGALSTVQRLADSGCEAADAALGAETLAIAARYHGEALSDPLALLAPSAQAQADAGYAALADAPDEPACAALRAALDDARRTLYPEAAR